MIAKFEDLFEKETVNLGFDFGTFDSSMAYVNKENQLKSLLPLNNPNVRSGVPSLFYYSTKVSAPLLCDQVRTSNYEYDDPQHTVSSIKMRLATHNFVLDDRTFTSEDIAIEIIKYNYQIALDALKIEGLYESSKKVVVGIPASFGTEEKQGIKEAIKKAGLTPLRLLPEPVAAGIYFSSTHGNVDTPIMVCDIGAGTTDLALIRKCVPSSKNPYPYEVMRFDGKKVAGDDFDEVMCNLIISKFESDPNCKIDCQKLKVKNSYYYLKLKTEARKAKESLSTSEIYNSTFFDQDIGGAQFSVTTDEFEKAARPLMDKIMQATENLLNKEGLLHDNYLKIICVGGSSYMPIVKKSLRALCPNLTDEDIFINEPDFAITYGCALYANDSSIIDSKGNFSYAVDTYSKDVLSLDVVVPAGVSLPYTSKNDYLTRYENQAWVIFNFFEIKGYYEGIIDYDYGEPVQYDLRYSFGRAVKKGTPVILEISVDQDGILSACAYEEGSDRQKAEATFNIFNSGERR